MVYGGKVEVISYFDNKEGLPKVYNNSIDSDKCRDADIIVFLHSDVIVNDIQLFEKLLAAKERGWDVVGVAGAKGYEIPNPN